MAPIKRVWEKGRVLRAAAEAMVLLPALSLLTFWVGGETALVVLAVLAPAVWLALSSSLRPSEPVPPPRGLGGAEDMVGFLDPILRDMPIKGRTTACFVISFDDPARQFDRHGQALRDQVVLRTAERLSAAVREGDLVVRLADGSLAVGLSAVRRYDLETAVQMATRLRSEAIVPIVVDALTLHPSVSVGFCLAERAPAPKGSSLLDAACIAADEALFHGPGAIRAFQPDMSRRRADRVLLRQGVQKALDEGQIRPWFQPQICADTGRLSGFEALARWHHPERGIISPADFLPVIEEAGLSERLGDVILYGALAALNRWDQAGFAVPQVSINLSASELRAPGLANKLSWEMDRFGLDRSRLTVEVLETVTATSEDDQVIANLAAIAKMGFGIDLDDFGTGQASIGNIRRFSIRRIKIDRSFVTHIDTDPEQKKVVAAILMLCDQLGLQTVAEGVETPGERVVLEQLGCSFLQGFGIARPMAMEETFSWIERAEAALQAKPALGRIIPPRQG
ncbi:putative bifunctional diguanylate cyclase/phosphodiesterase [Pseudotabrizicola sp. L79]|uniref:putative bifunctional diguanylate cyclase/phosphodiesterase n=1 Tax=Pseudotabrizicola sp. L79 TaxID=3118402 RepID=UPI002F925261